ncbi:hypothetical protein IAD21_04305 [Abditibacteriota bacterium]|nr:hypothetical protein IAD21_04305 [Abditibacteriota bacterium]
MPILYVSSRQLPLADTASHVPTIRLPFYCVTLICIAYNKPSCKRADSLIMFME